MYCDLEAPPTELLIEMAKPYSCDRLDSMLGYFMCTEHEETNGQLIHIAGSMGNHAFIKWSLLDGLLEFKTEDMDDITVVNCSPTRNVFIVRSLF